MKKITKFLTLVLSLFCVFGMISPVYAEESTTTITTLNYIDDSTSEVLLTLQQISSGQFKYVEKDKSYTVEIQGTGEYDINSVAEEIKNTDGLTLDGVSGDTAEEGFGYKVHFTVTKAGVNKDIKIADKIRLYIRASITKEDDPYFISYRVFDDGDGSSSASNPEMTSESTDGYEYTLNVGTWYGLSFNWTGYLGTSGQTRLDKFTETGYFEAGNSTLTNDGNGLGTMYGWEYFCFKPTKAGTTSVEIFGGKKVTFHIVDPNATEDTNYVTVENFDDVTVTSGTLDVDCWPKVTWNTDIMDQEKYFSEELFESKDGGSTWSSLYKLEPQSGYDTLAVELTTKDSGRMYKLVCTYDGTELYNKTKTVTVVDKTATAETTEGTPSTTTTYDEGAIVNTVKESYLTDEQKEAVDNGASVEVKTTASKIEPTAEDKNLVEAQLNSNNTVAMYLDLKVLASVTKDGEQVGDTVTVSETGTPVKFTIALDDAYINTKDTVERTYQVVRVHNGTVDVLPASFDAESKTITFETDKFSTYAIMYTDTVKASKTPSTSDTTTVGLYGGMAVVSVLAVGLLFFFKKKNA